jgi:hypothetical protein
MRAHAQHFDVYRFKKEMAEFVAEKMAAFNVSFPAAGIHGQQLKS